MTLGIQRLITGVWGWGKCDGNFVLGIGCLACGFLCVIFQRFIGVQTNASLQYFFCVFGFSWKRLAPWHSHYLTRVIISFLSPLDSYMPILSSSAEAQNLMTYSRENSKIVNLSTCSSSRQNMGVAPDPFHKLQRRPVKYNPSPLLAEKSP